MAKNKGFIPKVDEQFNLFFKNIVQYVGQKTGGSPAEWAHIPKASVDSFADSYAAWYTAYAVTLKPHTPPETREKNRVKTEAGKALRSFINQFLRFPPVTDQDRDNMGIPNRSPSRSPVNPPTEMVEFSFRVKNFRQVLVDFKVEGRAGKAKPEGYSGAVVIWAALDRAPASHEELVRHKLATRTPYTLTFTEAERGKAMYAALCWENKKGQQGPMSAIQSTIVP